MRIHLPIALLLLAGCSSHASKQDQLNAATNESTSGPTGAAGNGMNGEVALNGTASAPAGNVIATVPQKKVTRPNLAKSASSQQPSERLPDEPGNSNSD
jgi:hypothetical protein